MEDEIPCGAVADSVRALPRFCTDHYMKNQIGVTLWRLTL